MEVRPHICLDFDGVLHRYSCQPTGPRNIPDPPVPGAIAWLIDAMGWAEVSISSGRSQSWGARSAMRRWLRFYISREAPGADAGALVRRIRWPRFKPNADVYIDDRAVVFDGTWDAPTLTRSAIENFRPWNRR